MIWYESQPMKKSAARQLFEQGHHRDVVEKTTFPGRTREESLALIGSLAALGRLEEAVEVWNLRGASLHDDEKSRARFALAIAFTRVSKFKSARSWLRGSLRDSDCRELPDVYQGLAVYHYYLGNFEKAAMNARKALNLAIKLGDSYIHAFAIDLYGHALVQTGQRSAGLAKLAQAQELAKKKGGADPYSPARLAYEAEAGLRAHSIVKELEEQIANLRTEDTYTKANLILELARQLTLRGRWTESRALLDQVSPIIYSFQNRRQEAVLQLRLAELAYRQGDYAQATHFLQAARRCLHKIADSVYEARVIGLEQKIERAQGRELSHESQTRAAQLVDLQSASINTRTYLRSRKQPSTAHPGEDPLGDLLDKVARDPQEHAHLLLDAGYLGLWPEAHGLRAGESALVILDDLKWVAVSREGVQKSETELSTLSYKIVRLLSQGTIGKEQLITDVWGYEYDPLRHDPMIYTALASLRKSFGAVGFWVETQDEGWSLKNRGANVKFMDRETQAIEAPPVAIIAAPTNDLNWRQLKAMKKMSEPWTVPLYKDLFNVSTMTAWRDLDLLAKAGYLTRIGRGRATVYLHAKNLES